MICWTPKSNVSRRHQVHLSPGSYGPERGDSHEDEKEKIKVGKKRSRVGTFILPQSTQHVLLLLIIFFLIFFFFSCVVHFVLPLSSVLVLTASVLILTTLIYMDWVDFGVPSIELWHSTYHSLTLASVTFFIDHWSLSLTCNPWKRAKDNTIVVSSFY